MNVKKRDGSIVEYDHAKIINAIALAGEATKEFGNLEAKKISYKFIIKKDLVTIEEIQDIVEDALMSSKYRKTARAYIRFRYQRERLRNLNSDTVVNEYVKNLDWSIKENSNTSYSAQGLNNHITTKVLSNYWLDVLYPKEIKDAHLRGDFHIHDLGHLAGYCFGWDLQDLLLKGFCGVNFKTESAPPKHFSGAVGQIVNFFYTLQGEAAGAVALSNFDTLLAPYVYFDKLTYKQVKQTMQSFIFNVNIPTRAGFQVPFTNITMDIECSPVFRDQPVNIKGITTDRTYGDFQKQMDMINLAFCELMSEGDCKGQVFTFPIPTYNITKDFDWKSRVAKAIFKMTGKYGIPYFANFVNSDMNPEDTRSMCCRISLDIRELRKRGGGLFGSNPLTGSVGVVTINLPALANKDEKNNDIITKLKTVFMLAIKSLRIKRKTVERFMEQGLYPYSKYYLQAIKDKTGAYFSNHFSTVGIIGMNELLERMGMDGIDSKKGKEFALEIMDEINRWLAQVQQADNCVYNLEATPAEGATRRLAKLINHKNDYLTNSTWLPADCTENYKFVLDHQDELQCRYTGGTVTHLYTPQAIEPDQVKALVKSIVENYKLPYFSITPTFSICQEHGYLEGEHEKCKICGEPTEIFSRVAGYIRPISQWNDGKQAEFKERIMYNILPFK